jgi:hypothetical protein
VKKLFHDVIVEDRKQLQHLNSKAEDLIAISDAAPAPQFPQTESKSGKSGSYLLHQDATRITALGNKFEKSQITNADRLELTIEPGKQMKVPAARPGGPASGRVVSGNGASGSASPQRTQTGFRNPVPVEASSGSGGGFFKAVISLALLVGAGYFGFDQLQNQGALFSREPAAEALQTEGRPAKIAKVPNARLKLRLFPDGNFSSIRALLNSTRIDLSQGSTPVMVGEPLELVVERPGFVTFRKEFMVKETDLNDAKEFGLDIKLEPMVYGTFTLSTVPELADVSIVNLDQGSSGNAQKTVVLKTPVYQEKLPVGHYKVMVRNDLLGVEKSFQIEIKEGDRVVKNGVTLEAARAPSSNR